LHKVKTRENCLLNDVFWSKIGPFAAEISPCKDSGFGDFSVAVYELAFRHFASFLKPKRRAKKSASQVKIGQIVHHTVLFFKRSRHLGYPCYRGSKSSWDVKMGFQASGL